MPAEYAYLGDRRCGTCIQKIETMPAEYAYLGDRLTRPGLRGAKCSAVRRADGKCVRGRNGSMLVVFEGGHRCVVLACRLRKVRNPKGGKRT